MWESQQVKSFLEQGCRGQARVELKTISPFVGSGATAGGPMIAPDVRTDPVILPRQRLTVRNLLMPGQTTQNSVWYPRQTARYLYAGAVAEGATKPQSDFTTEQKEAAVVTIAHFINVARQAFDDAPALQSMINGELRYGLGLAEEGELLLGDGTGPHLSGLITNATTYAAPYSFGAGETAIDRLALALLQSEQALLPASGIVLNMLDWTKMKLQKNTLGNYILGDPASAAPPVLWSVPLVITPSIPAGHFLVGAFNLAGQIWDRMGVEILVSSEHADNFTKNLYTIRAERRLAMGILRPAALVYGQFPS